MPNTRWVALTRARRFPLRVFEVQQQRAVASGYVTALTATHASAIQPARSSEPPPWPNCISSTPATITAPIASAGSGTLARASL